MSSSKLNDTLTHSSFDLTNRIQTIIIKSYSNMSIKNENNNSKFVNITTTMSIPKILNSIDLPSYINKSDFEYNISLILKRYDIVDIKISNGMSIVLICSNRLSNTLTVFQYYLSQNTISNIQNIFKIIKDANHLRLPDSKYIFKYKVNDFLVPYISRTHSLLNWKYVRPLNDLSIDVLASVISKNLKKILWDIGLAIYGLYTLGISHRDARLDNVGIDLERKTFVLFDFDGSVVNFSAQYDDDVSDLLNSIDYYSSDLNLIHSYDFNKIWKMPYSFCLNVNMVYDYVQENKENNVSFIMALDYFDSLPLIF